LNLLYCCVDENIFPSSSWGENAVEPTPKLETGWANFDSSVEEPVLTNGDIVIEHHELLSDVIEQNIQDSTLFELNDTILPIKNLTSKN